MIVASFLIGVFIGIMIGFSACAVFVMAKKEDEK